MSQTTQHSFPVSLLLNLRTDSALVANDNGVRRPVDPDALLTIVTTDAPPANDITAAGIQAKLFEISAAWS